MFNQTLSELRMAEHTARTERVNREGWMRQKPTSSGREHTRRHLGDALVWLGVRLQGTRAVRAADAPAAGYTLDVVR